MGEQREKASGGYADDAPDDGNDGGCACGAVRFQVRGEHVRGGICHCMTCRKAHASPFNAFVIFPRDRVVFHGVLREWQSSADYARAFCPACGSRVCGLSPGEVELSMGSFDAVGRFRPQYESWIGRREPWVAPLDVPQNTGNHD
jgi:hypothetical protein